jgi:hypothetical protein
MLLIMSDNLEQARKQLAVIIYPLVDEQAKYLERIKRESLKQMEREDLVWLSLLSSMSTMGNVRGYLGLICTRENYEKVTFEALSQLPSHKDRVHVLKATLRAAKVRFPDRKAEWLAANFEAIVKMGGLFAAKEQLFGAKGKEGKIKFLDGFVGISDKYARDIMMDTYHPEFRDSIAVDERLRGISQELGLSFKDYESHENFYLDVAREVGLEGWELDRLMFRFVDDIICSLRMGR